MPATEVRLFRDDDGVIPIKQWLDELERSEPKVYRKCLARILELVDRGNEMLSHGVTKEDKVRPRDIDLALERMDRVKKAPNRYTVDFEL